MYKDAIEMNYSRIYYQNNAIANSNEVYRINMFNGISKSTLFKNAFVKDYDICNPCSSISELINTLYNKKI